MKLDATDLRYVTSEEFRVLTAVEMGSKNHEVVPNTLIAQIAGLRHGGVNKILGSLAKRNLVAKVQNSKYDGYRLTYGGYDFLALRALSKRDSVYSVGNQIGVGKESDIYIVADLNGDEMVLKLHRLGRVSFRAIKEKRDYMGKRKSASWMYMSRLAAQKEWAFMKVLHEHGFPVPRPVDQARHCILMEFIDSYPLRQISEVPSPGKLYSQLMDLIVRFAHAGLIHGDFNEFNILIREETGEPVVIDFPQMVSTSHVNAEWYFNRDVECIRRFFKRRFRYESSLFPRFRTVLVEGEKEAGFKLDVMVAASGFGSKEQQTLEEYMEAVREDDEEEEEEGTSESEEEESETEGTNIKREDDADDADADMATVGDKGSETVEEAPLQELGSGEIDDEEDESEDAGANTSKTRVAFQRSPSLSPSASLAERTAALHLSTPIQDSNLNPRPELNQGQDVTLQPESSALVKERVAKDINRQRTRQASKYHSKASARAIGRPKGSKAKQSTRVNLEREAGWD